MPFQKGQSGNPAGRPKGAREKRLKWMLSDERALQKRVVKDALKGNQRAMQIVADRLWPKLRPEALPVRVKTDSSDLASQGAAIITAALSGKLTPDVLRDLLSALADQARLVEFTEIEARLQVLEEKREAPPWERNELLPIRGKRKRLTT